MHHVDLTSDVQNGLAWFYMLCAVANGWFAYAQYQQGKRGWSIGWAAVAALMFLLSLLYLAHNLGSTFDFGPTLPTWLKDLSDQGLQRGLITLGWSPGDGKQMTLNDGLVQLTGWLLALTTIAWAVDAIASYCFTNGIRSMVTAFTARFLGSDPHGRMLWWSLIWTALSLILWGTGAVTYFVAANAGFAAVLYWRKTCTEPNVAWIGLNLLLVYGGFSMTDADFRSVVGKPDNVPIVFLIATVAYFTWLALRRAVLNDERMERGEPPLEKLEDEKVLVWPDLVYTELICMVVCTVILVVWAIALPAPLEQPASSTKTPNPSKAPWYFLGLQEMLVYYDPWLAGVVLPTLIIIGLMAMPYIDYNQKGNGYYTFNQRAFSIIAWLYGFIVLWVVLIILGTFLRGPNWNFYGFYEYWDPHKLVPLNNVNLSDYFWIRGLGMIWADPSGQVNWLYVLIREAPGILLVLFYFLAVPPLLARTVMREYFLRMGFIRYMTLMILVLFMAALPIKMVLRWTINLKYIVAIPEAFFHF